MPIRTLAVVALLLAPGMGRVAAAAADAPREVLVEDAVAAWTIARGWLDRYALPREHEAAAAVVVGGAHAVSVLIRAGGEIVGRGELMEFDGLSLRRAMSRAMGDAWGGGLRSLVEASGETEVGPRLTLEIEFAGEPQPLLGRTFADAARRLRPGIDGLALRRGTRWSYAFPGRLLASNTADNIAGAFGALAGELGLPVRDLPELRAADEVAAYRVPTLRLVQLEPGGPPTTLVRNDELVLESAIAPDSLALLAGEVARRLVRAVYRETPEGEGKLFLGDYRPVADERRPIVAPALEQALACLALLRLDESDCLVAAGVPEATIIEAEARNTALRVLGTLAEERTALGQPFEDPRTAALALLACHAVSPEARPPWLVAMRAWAVERMGLGPDPRQGFLGDDGTPLPAHAQAILAAAWMRECAAGGARATPADAIARLDAAWESATPTEWVALLPWIALAERSVPADAARDAARDAAVGRLRELREQLYGTQIGYADLTSDRQMDLDLVGGFVLVGTDGLAGAQSLRPLSGLAAMLGDARMTPREEHPRVLARQVAGLRFLVQLVVRPPLDALYRRPEAAIWGVRQSTWDSDQPVAAQALALLTLVESLEAWTPSER